MRRLLVPLLLLLCGLSAVGAQDVSFAPFQVNANHPLARGLVAWYPMLAEIQNGRKLWDIVGINHGTLSGNTAYGPDATGKFAAAMNFDGADDYVTIPNVPALAFERTQPFTIVAQFRTGSVTGGCLVCKSHNNTDFAGYWLVFTSGNPSQLTFLLVDVGGAHAISVQTTGAYNDAQMHTAVARYAGTSAASGLSLLIDGVPVATTNPSATTLTATLITTDALMLGNETTLTSDHFGQIGQVALYNRVLTDAEARQWAEMQAPAYGGLLQEPLLALAGPVAGANKGAFFQFFQPQ